MTTNQDLVTRVHEFGESCRNKNSLFASNIRTVVLSMLEYDKPLQDASRDELLALSGIGHSNVDYLLRVLKGEEVKSVVEEVPTVRPPIQTRYYGPRSVESGNFDGSWDNSVRNLEDREDR